MEYEAIVLAAGNSTRSGLSFNKVLYDLDGTPMILFSTRNFINDEDCKKIHVVVKEEEIALFKVLYKGVFKVDFVIGGNTRCESVSHGLEVCNSDYVLIHDGARPFYTSNLIELLKEGLEKANAVVPGLKVTDTIKKIKDGKVVETLNREELVSIQTPQAFKLTTIKKAFANRDKDNYFDDASMVEEIIHEDVVIVEGEVNNKKFTVKEDF